MTLPSAGREAARRMREVITGADVEQAARERKRELAVSPDAIITDVARETAQRLGVALVPSAREAHLGQPVAAPAGAASDPLSEWRREFPALERYIHVANCSQSPQSRRVRQAVEAYLESWFSQGMDWDRWMSEVDACKQAFARLIGADAADISVASSVSEATAALASGLDFSGTRRKVVVGENEFPTIGHVWLAAARWGAQVDFVPVRNWRITPEELVAHIDSQTLVVSVSHVYYQNGYKQPLAPIVEAAHRHGAIVVVDAYQSLGTTPLDVRELDIDVLTSGTLKYLLGVPGIAFMYVKREVAERLRPAVTGWFGQRDPFAFNIRELEYAPGARRFDTGTPPVINAYAARAGIEMLLEIGVERIARKIDDLSRHALELADRHGMEVISPRDIRFKGATTAIRVPNSHQVEEALKRRGIVASARGPAIRIAPHFFTSFDDLERVFATLAEVLKRGA